MHDKNKIVNELDHLQDSLMAHNMIVNIYHTKATKKEAIVGELIKFCTIYSDKEPGAKNKAEHVTQERCKIFRESTREEWEKELASTGVY